MGRIFAWGLSILVLAAGAFAIWIWGWLTALESERITEDLHVVATESIGGNVGVLRTGSGAVVVDTMTFRMQGEGIRELAESLTGEAVHVVINTHYHQDHTHGNPAFPSGMRVVSTERTLELLETRDAAYWEGDAAGTLPNETFGRSHEIRLGDKTVRALHLGAGHTSGDLVVLFVEDRALHTGDLLFNGRYPNIDLEAGGSIRAWIQTLDRLLLLDFDVVIPGHGPLTDRDGIRRFQDFLRELLAAGERAAREGWSLEETLERTDLESDAGYGTIGIPFVFRLDRDFVVRRAWEEATGAVQGG